MKFLRSAGIAFSLISSVTSAEAASYCWSDPGKMFDGGTTTISLKIVVSSVKRPHIPGLNDNRPWCIMSWSSLGGNMGGKIIQKAKLGEGRVVGYKTMYKGDKIGHDSFKAEVQWVRGSDNKMQKATLIYEIDIVSDPF